MMWPSAGTTEIVGMWKSKLRIPTFPQSILQKDLTRESRFIEDAETDG